MSNVKTEFHPAVYWYLTERCNLQCKHCWVSASPTSGAGHELSLAQVTKVLDDFVKLGITSIIFSGGEPLLHKQIMEIIRETIKRRIPFGIESNALLINEELLQVIKDTEADFRKYRFGISLDGGNASAHDYIRGEGTFRKTLQKITRLKEKEIPFSLQCVVNKSNLGTIPELIPLAAELGAESLTFGILHPVGRALEALHDASLSPDDLEQMMSYILENSAIYPQLTINLKVLPAMISPSNHMKLKQNPQIRIVTNCQFPMIGITPEGVITFCSLTKNDLTFGNVKTDSILDVVKEMDYQHLHEEYQGCAKLEGICASCIFKCSCKGSCRSLAYSEYKSIYAPHPFCQQMQDQGTFPRIYQRAK